MFPKCPVCQEKVTDTVCQESVSSLIFFAEPCHCSITEDQYYKLIDALESISSDDIDDDYDDNDYGFNTEYDDDWEDDEDFDDWDDDDDEDY